MAGYQSLLDLGQAQKGDRILIIGAAGSAGGTALQIAKELGTYVYAVDIPEKAAFTRTLGPDRFIDSSAERFEDVVGSVDLVLDFVAGDYQQRSLNVLKSGGRYITSLFIQLPPEELERRGIRSAGLATQPRVEQLDDLAQRIDTGRLKTFLNRTFPLDEAQAAMEFRMQTIHPGKVVLTVL
jgi:NADPH:quinone reductase-like Zn-dependent oxidoreductase